MKIDSVSYRSKVLNFSAISGDVVGTEKYSKTYVGSTGGGGHVGPSGGRVDAPTIYSTAITHHNFWIMLPDGREKDVQLEGVDVPLREGQFVTVISAHSDDMAEWVAIINHNSQEFRQVISGSGLVDKLDLDPSSGKPLVFGILIWIVMGWLGSWAMGFIFGGLLVWVKHAERNERINTFRERLSKHIEATAQSILRADRSKAANLGQNGLGSLNPSILTASGEA